MIRITITTVFLIYVGTLFGQTKQTLHDTIATYFDEVKLATYKNTDLWNLDIYGPILLVNPITREVYANTSDSLGALKKDGKIFTGILPQNVIIANASIKWNGIKWAMILLPFISKNSKEERINLLSHELFHRSQSSLNFNLIETNNGHLDKMDGRIYLRLELEALKKAIQAGGNDEMKQHLTNALTFRKYRYILYPGADTTENWSELNEGITEYTGIIISGRSKMKTNIYLVHKIDDLIAGGTFVRTFAYRTTPVYGYLLRRTNKFWNKQISSKTNLTSFFIKEFGLSIPQNLEIAVKEISEQYSGEQIFTEETEREAKTKKLIAEFIDKFINQPHFEIVFENKKASFDSRNLLPLEGYGTVYPTMTISDNWGLLTIKGVGGLMSVNRDKVIITRPLKIDGKNISGDGWTLQLNDGYVIVKDENSSNYFLTKK